MAWRAWTRWTLFASYILAFFTIPLSILWGLAGFAVGGVIAASFLFSLVWRAPERIALRLRAQEIRAAEAPAFVAMVREYCRRLDLPMPKLYALETPALNLAVFGHTRKRGHLVVTRGALTTLPREGLGALAARELTYLHYGETTLETTLSQLLSLIDGLVMPRRRSARQAAPRFYPFGLFVRQVFLYPMCLVPSFLLRRTPAPEYLDEVSIRVARDPLALGEALRRLQARHDRVPLAVAFSTRHLFLAPPTAADPLARIFFAASDLSARIREVEGFRKEVSLAGAGP